MSTLMTNSFPPRVWLGVGLNSGRPQGDMKVFDSEVSAAHWASEGKRRVVGPLDLTNVKDRVGKAVPAQYVLEQPDDIVDLGTAEIDRDPW